MKKNRWKKASMTVEAALLMPLILMVMFGLILLLMFVHNRAWYTQASVEAVLTASACGMYSTEEADSVLVRKMTEKKGRQGFPLKDLSVETATGADHVSVETKLSSKGVLGVGFWQTSWETKTKIVRPVSFIRGIQTVNAWREE